MIQKKPVKQRRSLPKPIDLLTFERELWNQGYRAVAGVDEAGRGPLAGPVVAAACILPIGIHFPFVNDSKQLPPPAREHAYKQLTSHPQVIWAVAQCSVEQIDTLNILRASLLAMKEAVEKLPTPPDFVLVDGRDSLQLAILQQAVIQGDGRCQSVAAASIIAKVTRDALMVEYDRLYPSYGFKNHKGYATKAHLNALQKLGPTPIHRKTFAPCKCPAV